MKLSRAQGRPAGLGEIYDYLDEIAAFPLLSAEGERAVAEAVADGDPEAREELIRSNLRLVVFVGRDYLDRGVSGGDLIAEGNLGLIRAVEGYDAGTATKFSTYASHWIKQSCRRIVKNQGRMVRLPSHTVSLLHKWGLAEARLASALGRPPSEAEIAAALGLSRLRLNLAREAIAARNLTPSVRPDADKHGDPYASLVDERQAATIDALAEAETLALALARLGRLDARSSTVVRLRYGLDGSDPLTLREIGLRVGLTRETVRTVETRAIERLRIP